MLNNNITEQVYNCWDCIATSRIHQEMVKEDWGRSGARFDHGTMGPALTMSLRGLRVNHKAVKIAKEETEDKASGLKKEFEEVIGVPWKWAKGLKPAPVSFAKLLYGKMKVKPHYNRDGNYTVDKEAISKILDDPKTPDDAWEAVNIAQQLDVLEEDRKVLNKPLSPDGRMHCSYNVAGTTSGRWGSRQNCFDEGANLHALSRHLHKIFIPEDGYVFVNIDQKQGESKIVAYLAGCETYKQAHLRGNLHVNTGSRIFPDIIKDVASAKNTMLPWDGRKSYYDLSKRISHACLDSQTEVMTKKGWVKVEDFTGKEDIAVWDSDYSIKWETPKSWNVYEFSGDLVRGVGSHADFFCTEDHKLPMFNNGGKLYEKFAGDLPFSYGTMPLGGYLKNPSGPNITDTEARLLAATWADGHLRNDGWTVFGIKKPRKIERLVKLLSDAGEDIHYWVQHCNVKQFAIKKHLRKSLGWDMILWPESARDAFLDELPYWDGNIDKGYLRVFNTDKKAMEIIATLCHLSNKAARIMPHGKLRKGDNRKQCWYLHIRRAQVNNKSVTCSCVAYSGIKVTKQEYTGKIYCPTTSTGWFLIRRNGLITVTGNSNYAQTPWGMARHLRIKVDVARELQDKYFEAFPEIRIWHQDIFNQLKIYHYLTTPFGRFRHFLGRTFEPSIVKEGTAYVPQSTCSQINKIVLWRIWNYFDNGRALINHENHDSVLYQVREGDTETMEEILEKIKFTLPIRGDIMTPVYEANFGHSWGEEDMQEWKGKF